MAKFVMRDAYVAIAGTPYSDHASSCTIEDKADEVDVSSFGPAGYREIAQGLRDCTVTVEFFADFAASGGANAALQPLYAGGGTFLLEVRPTSGTRSATNPAALMTARLFSYPGFSGKIGDAATTEAIFRNGSTAGLTWATA
jgi:hypothetical protein